MPRGRPPKNKGVTIKSKETQIFFGFLFLGLGIGIAISNTVSGKIPELVYSLLGVNRYLVGLFISLYGLKLIGLKHHITSTKMTWGLITLFFVLATMLGFLWQFVARIYYPGTIGLKIHEFLYQYLGPYIEILTLIPILILSTALIFNLEYSKLAEIFKQVVQYSVDSVIFTSNFIIKILQKAINALRLLISKIFNIFKQSKQTQPELNSENNLATDALQTQENPFNIDENQDTLTNATTNTSFENAILENNIQNQTEPQQPPQIQKTTTNNQDSTAQAPTDKPTIEIDFGKPLYTKPGATPKKDQTTKPKPQPQEQVVQISPVEKRLYSIYSKHTVSVTPPPLTIFDKPEKDEINTAEIRETSQKIEQALASFKIQAKVTKFFVGPSVIQYALNLATGTKVSKVESLAKDIALAIAAPKGSIRIDTIAGTNLVGIEVPRVKQHTVKISEVLASQDFLKTTYELPMAIGKNVQAKPVVINLYDMPHLLVAGATGTGKSVALNTIIASMLIRFKPDNLRLILVDPKMVEMELYNGIPHLLTPVITDMNQVLGALEWLIFEMQQRYQLFKEKGLRNLKEYNAYAKAKGSPTLPYLVLIIDEMADLILTKRNEVEGRIVRLAQLARATGIHLILATQRPSVNVITGLIKANIPARIALAVASQVDSRVIIDQSGAEHLIGKGDMLIKLPNSIKPERVQGAFISTQEVQRLTNYLKNKAKEITTDTTQMYMEELLNYMQTGGKPTPSLDSIKAGDMSQLSSLDPLLPEAVKIVLQSKKASSSSLQRYLKIGFNRAARLIDYMEQLGIVSPPIGNKRQVLIDSIEEIG